MILPVFLPHLGCGRRCTYCNQNLITGTGAEGETDTRKRLASLFETLKEPAEIALYGGNVLGLDPAGLERLFGLFSPYRDRITRFRISAKPGPLSALAIDILKRHGVRVVELGMPTFNDRILDALERGHNGEDALTTYKLLKDAGFEMGIQVMVGLPGERHDDVKETASVLIRLHPSFIRIYPLLVIENTRLFELYRAGLFAPESLEGAIAKAVFIYVNAWQREIRTIKMGLTESELLRDTIAAGPFHPAFGYLVKSEAFQRAVTGRSEEAGLTGDVVVRLHKSDVPHLIGYRRSGIEKLRGRGIETAWMVDPTVQPGHFVIEGSGKTVKGSLADAVATISH